MGIVIGDIYIAQNEAKVDRAAQTKARGYAGDHKPLGQIVQTGVEEA
jgi:hypothetical protein